MNFLHQNGTLAIYGLYVEDHIASEDEATMLIQQAFPAMQPFIQNNALFAVADDSHTTYSASMTSDTMILGKTFPISYRFGTQTIPRYTLIYAVVGIGESFIELVENMPKS